MKREEEERERMNTKDREIEIAEEEERERETRKRFTTIFGVPGMRMFVTSVCLFVDRTIATRKNIRSDRLCRLFSSAFFSDLVSPLDGKNCCSSSSIVSLGEESDFNPLSLSSFTFFSMNAFSTVKNWREKIVIVKFFQCLHCFRQLLTNKKHTLSLSIQLNENLLKKNKDDLQEGNQNEEKIFFEFVSKKE